MSIPQVVSAEEWRAVRMDLLAREKEVTRAKDAVDAARRELPVTELTKDYTFTGPAGPVGLPGLFGGHRQLITYHFMWRHEQSGFPGEDQGCPTCSFLADSIGDLSHLHACDTTLVLVSRAPIASIERFRKRMGWAVPWYSSYGSDFNYDFLRDGDRVFHAYSAYQRGLDSLLGTYRWLDLTPLGRQRHVTGFPHHDTYDHEP
jgi:predicted dithiol-disulfide oxidoreductase (DUF899 family)